MNRRPDSIVLAERQVAEARAAALDEYLAARAKLRRRLGSPVFIGGVLLGAIALGYLALGRGRPKPPVYPESRSAWWGVARTAQVLLPLLIALDSATKPARRPGADSSGTER